MYLPSEYQNTAREGQATSIQRFEDHVRARDFPCVGAKSALARGRMHYVTAGHIGCPRDDDRIYAALREFASAYGASPGPFQSLVVLFDAPSTMSETDFERLMWLRLQALEEIDAAQGQVYDPRVSSDIDDPRFSLSFAGEAFFVVGLHPGASRPARRFATPALVFNPHDQFETLRAEDRYESLRAKIIERDVALAGSPNPMLSRHGERSEARQYSGRATDDAWACPFHRVHDQ